ncbi:hypothetical protein N7478_010701 [Penicillium angulare]|uniref:uncharacterized protein n=1 Tax=Penicillium angulare TaxID=116970 RepID=UPI00253FCF08|nr:uncharacterized protein N7478_010701 [Penicillium angulare]KAJ5267893.1 hypothetical protein N7478_010701 [Penicillium angulare]
MECPITTEGDYMNSHATGSPISDDDSQPAERPVVMLVANGMRYHTQQSVIEDLQLPLRATRPAFPALLVIAFSS